MAQRDDRPLILLAWRRPPPPFFLGGAEISQALLARNLARAGYRVRYLGSFDAPWSGGGRIRQEVLQWLRQTGIEPAFEGGADEDGFSYLWRGVECRVCAGDSLEGALSAELRHEPEIVITSQEGSAQLLCAAARTAPTTVGWIHSVSATGMLAAEAAPSHLLCVSRFVRERVRRRFGRDGLLFYPPFAPVCAEARRSSEGEITMVNPIPEKGRDLFLQLVERYPERGFVAVDGWYPATLPELPNLRHLARPAAMEAVWSGTSLLLAPSRLEEGFGRVCVEAGQRGVPALTSGRGGLPEAAGQGGLVADPDDPDAWCKAIESILEPDTHLELGRAARSNAMAFERDVVTELRESGVIP